MHLFKFQKYCQLSNRKPLETSPDTVLQRLFSVTLRKCTDMTFKLDPGCLLSNIVIPTECWPKLKLPKDYNFELEVRNVGSDNSYTDTKSKKQDRDKWRSLSVRNTVHMGLTATNSSLQAQVSQHYSKQNLHDRARRKRITSSHIPNALHDFGSSYH